MSAEFFTSHASREIVSSNKHDVLGNSEKKFRVLREGDGIHFPRRPLTKAAAERYVRYMSSVVCKLHSRFLTK